MPNYDLYTELGLDKDMPPAEIGSLLEQRINGLLGQGYQSNSPEVDQLTTARMILSDPSKRNAYEAALAGPDGVIDVSWLHQLADSRPTSSEAPTALSVGQQPVLSSGHAPSYDASVTNVLNAGGDPSSPQVPQSPLDQYGQSQFSQPGPYGQPSHNSGAFGAPVQQPPANSQFDVTSMSVAGRDRSQSKVYLTCLAIMVIGMIYPLILLFTSDDFDIFKGILFAIAHTVAWVGIAEIIWSVRRIVAPEENGADTGADITSAPDSAAK